MFHLLFCHHPDFFFHSSPLPAVLSFIQPPPLSCFHPFTQSFKVCIIITFLFLLIDFLLTFIFSIFFHPPLLVHGEPDHVRGGVLLLLLHQVHLLLLATLLQQPVHVLILEGNPLLLLSKLIVIIVILQVTFLPKQVMQNIRDLL